MGKIYKSLPLHRQVYNHIKEMILSGELKCGDKIQEVKLSELLKVSRSPVREALRMLQNDELIVFREPGLIVNPLTYEDTIEVYECRILLEPFAAKLASRRITLAELDSLEDCISNITSLKESNKIGNYPLIIKNNSKFHQIISEASKHKRIIYHIKKNNALSELARANEFYLFNRGLEYMNEHIEIFNALKLRDSNRVEAVVKSHIENDLNFYNSRYELVLKNGNQNPID